MPNLHLCFFGVAASVATSAALAQQPDYGPLPYDYGSIDYVLTELDSGGVELAGSYEVANRVIVFADYQNFEIGNTDRERLRLGGGYRWDLKPNIDLIAKLSYADNEIDPPGPGRIDDDGLMVGGEIRAWLARDFEVGGEITLDDSIGSGTETVLGIGGQYYFGDNASAGARLRIDDADTTVFIGVRFHFGASRRLLENRRRAVGAAGR